MYDAKDIVMAICCGICSIAAAIGVACEYTGWTDVTFLFSSIAVAFLFILIAIVVAKFITWIIYRW